MELSVVLPVYNAPDDVAVCLDSVARHLDGKRSELLILNDASGPETTELLRAFVRQAASGPQGQGASLHGKDASPHGKDASPKGEGVSRIGEDAGSRLSVRLVEQPENVGYLRNVNQGLAAASGDVIVLLNSDTAIPAGFAERVLACFASDPSIGLASPVGSHCGLFSVPMKPGLTGADVDVMDGFLRAWPPEYPTVILPDGFCFCARKTMLDQVGLFDERYAPGYFEETDLGMRARKAGWNTVLIDNLYVYHKAQASFGPERNRALVQRNEALFNSLWGGEFAALRARYPREEHKPRLYRRVYSLPERAWRRTVRFLAQAIPHAATRRRIRRAYN